MVIFELLWSVKAHAIGVNDLHIAVHTRSEGLTLVTNNLK